MPISITAATDSLKTGKLKFCMSSSSPAFTDSELESAIDQAVREYNKHAPHKVVQDFTITAGQGGYDWPADAIKIEPLLLSEASSLYAGSCASLERFECLYANQITSRALLKRAQANHMTRKEAAAREITVDRQLRKFYIAPEPAETFTAKLPVYKAHVKTDSGSDSVYQTIPDEHFDIVTGFAAAKLLQNVALAYAVNEEKIGDRDFRGVKTSGVLLGQADRLEEDFFNAFSGGVIVQG